MSPSVGPEQEDTPQWTDIANVYNNGYGNDVWFNALPSYAGSVPLWQIAKMFTTSGAINNTFFFNFKSLFYCPTATAQGILQTPDGTSTSNGTLDMRPNGRPLFSYSMNSKSVAYENLNAQTPLVYVKQSMVKSPSAYVLFSDVRNRSLETPFLCTSSYPTPPNDPSGNNWIVLATPHGYTTRFSSRHNGGGQITFSDGHAAYYKYGVVVADGSNPNIAKGCDPGNPQINWDVKGNVVPSSGGNPTD